MSLSARELKFVAEVARGSSPRVAYKSVYNPKTDNQDSIRAMASRIMQRPGVREAIESVKREMQADMITACVWDARAAMIARITDARRLDMEIDRQLQGIESELQGIESDETLPDSEKLKLKGRLMQRSVIARTVQIKQTIYADLDKSIQGAPTDGDQPLFMQLLQLNPDSICIQEDPDEYAASTATKPDIEKTAG
jgi:hypothetical protein